MTTKLSAGNRKSEKKPGTGNRFTTLKETFVEAFEGIGGADNLMEWARNNQDKFYPLMVRIFLKEAGLKEKSSANMHVALLDINAARRRAGMKGIEGIELHE